MKVNGGIAIALLMSAFATTARGDSFGSGPNSFSIDFVPVGNAGNAADTAGNPNPAGSVAVAFRIGKYEIGRGMIEAANSAGGLNLTLADMSLIGGNGPVQPATGLSWDEAARFVNWLNSSTANTPAYKFDNQGVFQLWAPGDPGYDSANRYRNGLAKYFLPSVDEWYKAAFYDGAAGVYYNYATGSNSLPTAVASGTAARSAVYDVMVSGGDPAPITLAGGLSPYGTMAQSGNVHEWMETGAGLGFPQAPTTSDPFALRINRGGNAATPPAFSSELSRNVRQLGFQDQSYPYTGFRVASQVPEPSAMVLGVTVATILVRRRRS
jgi:sulfatase modifying factor 1